MDEFKFIDSITQDYYRQGSVVKGIGDDAAVIRHPYHDIVTAVDTMVDGIHFSKDTVPPFYIGYRTLAANLSDIAAMGALPTAYMISLVVPKNYSNDELKEIYQGMDALARDYHIDLIGGDTVTGDQLVVTVTIIGTVEKNRARLRSHAKPGDVIFVTGTLGDSRLGLALLLNEETLSEDQAYFIRRHQQPTPRIHFARELANVKRVALNDVSDGISSEAAEIAKASHVTLILDDEMIPIHERLKELGDKKVTEYKYNGGEDFELIGTVPIKDYPYVLEAAKKHDIKLSIIGTVIDDEKTNNGVLLSKKGKIKPLKKSGYTHKN